MLSSRSRLTRKERGTSLVWAGHRAIIRPVCTSVSLSVKWKETMPLIQGQQGDGVTNRCETPRSR